MLPHGSILMGMNATMFLARINKDKKEWLGSIPQNSDEIRWVVRGLDIAIGHAKDLVREQSLRDDQRKPPVHKWCARDLYHAIRMALNALSRAERSVAIEILEKAKERAIGASLEH